MNRFLRVFAPCVLALGLQAEALDAKTPPIQPTPKSITVNPGSMALTAQSRIVVTDPRLEAHARVLADEISCLTDWRLSVAGGEARPGDIVLKINPAIRADEDILAAQNLKIVRTRDMAHTIEVADKAVVEGWDARAVCEGTIGLVQSIAGADGKFTIPHMTIKDWPHADFTAGMVDCGRQWIPADALKATVEACRMFKVRYLQLHVGDDQGYSFPSKALPKLGTQNGACCGGIPPKRWTWEEMEELEAFAAARGVCVVPALETPGHHGAMARCYRDLFDGPGCMDMASEELYKGLETVIDEMCSIFKSTPYFDIGCDECNWQGVGAGPWATVYKRRHAVELDPQPVRNPHEIYQVHLKRLADMLRKRGKLTLAWEDFPRDNRVNDDIIALIWYPHAVAQDYQRDGWTTITVPWELTAPFPEWNLYICNGSRLNRGDRVLGASRPMWQMSAICLVNGWMHGLGERMERTWGPDTPINPEEYDKRYSLNRERLNRLILPVKLETEGITMGITYFLGGQIAFGGNLKVTLSVAAPKGGTIHYTLDGSEPTPQSPVYTGPLNYKQSFALNAAYFFGDRQFGCVTRSRYDYNDIDGFISNWQLSGPYRMEGKTGRDLFDVEFEPEKGAGIWVPWKPGSNPMIVDFNALDIGGVGVMYLRTRIHSPKTQPAVLVLGSDDGIKAWLNDKPIHGNNVERSLGEEDRVEVTLHEGWNKLLLKINNGGGGWGAKARVRAPNGAVLEGLQTQPQQ